MKCLSLNSLTHLLLLQLAANKSSTQTLHKRLKSSNEEDEDTYNDQDDDAFDSECEEQSHCNELPRRRGENKEYRKIIIIATFDEAKKYLAEITLIIRSALKNLQQRAKKFIITVIVRKDVLRLFIF